MGKRDEVRRPVRIRSEGEERPREPRGRAGALERRRLIAAGAASQALGADARGVGHGEHDVALAHGGAGEDAAAADRRVDASEVLGAEDEIDGARHGGAGGVAELNLGQVGALGLAPRHEIVRHAHDRARRVRQGLAHVAPKSARSNETNGERR